MLPRQPRCVFYGEMGATIYKVEPFTGDEYRTNAPGFGMERNDIDDPLSNLLRQIKIGFRSI